MWEDVSLSSSPDTHLVIRWHVAWSCASLLDDEGQSQVLKAAHWDEHGKVHGAQVLHCITWLLHSPQHRLLQTSCYTRQILLFKPFTVYILLLANIS